MEKEISKIEISLDTEIFLKLCAKKCYFNNVGEFLEAIANDVSLCAIIVECLLRKDEDLKFYKLAQNKNYS